MSSCCTPLYVNGVKYIADNSSASRKTEWSYLTFMNAILSHQPFSLRTSLNQSISSFRSHGLKIVKINIEVNENFLAPNV